MKGILQGKSEEIFMMTNIRHNGIKTHPADDTSNTFIVHPTPGDSVIEDDYPSYPRCQGCLYIDGFSRDTKALMCQKIKIELITDYWHFTHLDQSNVHAISDSHECANRSTKIKYWVIFILS